MTDVPMVTVRNSSKNRFRKNSNAEFLRLDGLFKKLFYYPVNSFRLKI